MNPLETVQKELLAAREQRAEIENKISALEESLRLLEPIYRHIERDALLMELADDIPTLGITDATARLLAAMKDRWLGPTDVRDGLMSAGFKLVGRNPLSSIHQVLRRLAAKRGAIISKEIDGKLLYKFDSSTERNPN